MSVGGENLNIKLIAYTPSPEKIVAAASKLCYSNANIETLLEDLNEKKIESFISQLYQMGHESPMEHASFTFGIEGVSRSFLSQITRHRLASYSVQSQRYVKFDDNSELIIPDEIYNNEDALKIFSKCTNNSLNSYLEITNILKSKYISDGIPDKEATKKAIENARAVLPMSSSTKMIVTMNARSLLNFFKLRCCNRAQEEIRQVADEMLKLVRSVAPSIFKYAGPSCLYGECSEGKMSCGRPRYDLKF